MKTLLVKSFLLIFLVFSGCKKKDFTFTLKGVITDKTFSTGLVGATVVLEEFIAGGSTSDDLIHETTVATDGSYEFVFERRKATKYTLTVKKTNYFDIYEEIPFSDFSTEEALVKNFSTTAKAWVKLIFINDLPSTDFDEFKFTKQQGKVGCSECCSAAEQVFYGKAQQEYLCVNDGNTTYSYYYFATNPYDNNLMEIYTPAFDTVELIKHW